MEFSSAEQCVEWYFRQRGPDQIDDFSETYVLTPDNVESKIIDGVAVPMASFEDYVIALIDVEKILADCSAERQLMFKIESFLGQQEALDYISNLFLELPDRQIRRLRQTAYDDLYDVLEAEGYTKKE